MKKKKPKKKAAVKQPQRVKHEIVVRVEPQSIMPTVSDLSQPERDGKKLTIPSTWLTKDQIVRMVEKTPPQYVYKRPAKGGGTWDYVTVSYVQRVLDYVFGWNWDFEVVEHGKEANHVWVLGKLTIRSADGKHAITKTQFGRSDVKMLKTGGNLDYGNDLKSASSDSLKKCASMLGIARDIYGKTEYRQESGNEPLPSGSAGPQTVSQKPVEKKLSYKCDECGVEVTQSEAAYSIKMFKRILCRDHQKPAWRK